MKSEIEKITVVDIDGTPHQIPKGEDVDFRIMAKKCGSTRYLVVASNDGDLFNPQDTSNNIHKRDRERGGWFWRLQSCSAECYQQYTTFLRSKNLTPYVVAQRRFRNDF